MFRKCLLGCLIAGCGLNANAGDEKRWGADISLSAQHQEYEIVSADMNTLDLSPWFKKDDWTFTAYLPWMKIDGDYFINGNLSRIINFCQRLDTTPPQLLQRLVERGRITQRQIDRCNNVTDALAEREKSQSGLGDVHLTLDYLRYWGLTNSWWTSFAVGYKHDNGDVDSGLGSGSQDANLNVGAGYEGVSWFSHLGYSFTSVSATDTPFAVKDYAAVSVGVGYNLLSNLAWGLDYQKEEAYLEYADDINYWSSYLHWGISDNWAFTLAARDYNSGVEYPKKEYSAQIIYSF